jgi:O-antigen ligase
VTVLVPSPRPVAWPARFLRVAAGCVFAGLLVWAPLNFGSTRAGGPELLAAGCLAGTALWLLALALGAPRPRLPVVAFGAVILLLLAMLPWLTGLAQPTSVAPFTQTHFARIEARWPFSIVWRTPGNITALTLGLAVATLPLIDLARTPGWALLFAVALVATAVLVAILALAQNYTRATGIYWRADGRMAGNFCGTFFHHTSAGAYFNTAWPLAFALACLAWLRPAGAPFRGLLIGAASLSVVLLLAAHAGHVSRFPQLAALLVLPVLLSGLDWRAARRWIWLVGAALLVVVLVVLGGRTGDIAARWNLFFTAAPVTAAVVAAHPAPEAEWPALMRDDLFVPDGTEGHGLGFGARGEGWRTALRAIAARPLTGHGPANWIGAASHYSGDSFVRTFFQFLQFTHQDALQFAVEWGVPAALAWWTVLLGAVVVVFRARHALGAAHPLCLAAACALAAVLLQSLADFPLQIPAVAFNAVVLAALAWSGSAKRDWSSSTLPLSPA